MERGKREKEKRERAPVRKHKSDILKGMEGERNYRKRNREKDNLETEMGFFLFKSDLTTTIHSNQCTAAF